MHRLTVIPHGTVCLGPHLIRLGVRYGGTKVTALVNGPASPSTPSTANYSDT